MSMIVLGQVLCKRMALEELDSPVNAVGILVGHWTLDGTLA